MNLPPLPAHALAYYLAHSAKDFAMVGRWFPRSELLANFTDKIRIDVRPFGKPAQDAAGEAAEAYLAHMIASGGFQNKEQKFGGSMHQYDAATGGADFWQTAFAELSA
jgi:hypothetical protein